MPADGFLVEDVHADVLFQNVVSVFSWNARITVAKNLETAPALLFDYFIHVVLAQRREIEFGHRLFGIRNESRHCIEVFARALVFSCGPVLPIL